MKKTALLCVIFSLILAGRARGESFTGKVISVTDGNTICVACGARALQVKMAGVDCPDLDQPYGPQARDFLVTLIGSREVWVDVKRMDHYHRGDSTITLNGQDVAVQVVRAGLGWYDTRFISSAPIAEAEAQAREGKSGLWSQEKPLPPWEFRQVHRGIIPNMAAPPTHIGSGGGYGFVPVRDQTCTSSFGIHVLSMPTSYCRRSSYGPPPSPCGPGNFGRIFIPH